MNENFINNCFTAVSLLKDKFDIEDTIYVKNVPASYYNILDIINHVESITVTDLADYLNIPQPNCSRSIKKLIEKGWVSKNELAKDKRIQVLSLTVKGKELIDVNNHLMYEKIQNRLSSFDQKKISAINSDIEKIIKKIHEL